MQRVLSRDQLAALVPYSLNHIARLERRGEFPKRVKLGPARVGWLEAEVDAWIEARMRERDENEVQ